jgi:hypothetical protein
LNAAVTRSCRPPLRVSLGALIIIASIMLPGCDRTALDERFYDPSLPGWTVIDDPNTVEGKSVWRVERDGWLHQRSNIWGRRGDFIGRWYGTYLVAGDSAWRDYKFTVRAKPDDNDGFGVVFRFQDPTHFYRFFLLQDGMSGGPLTRLDKREGPDYTEIWSAHQGYKASQEVTIGVQVVGNTIRIDLNGVRLVEARDDSYRQGKIGLFCYAQDGQAFNNVRVILN